MAEEKELSDHKKTNNNSNNNDTILNTNPLPNDGIRPGLRGRGSTWLCHGNHDRACHDYS
eukprot:CAMPEP_0197186330 /NCGR_PEP_ID=MMETSP1423-20130617/13723_1 /TAXON_ID=476441 /ORGANISM="Pseudo-nitzschia heimii, Strain UNC1101" /LENGTH=59 /DNA_ID=CAMNT_0042637607 /DNA_START=261 /DNA_END=441 /DNA_ORIENTATION=+